MCESLVSSFTEVSRMIWGEQQYHNRKKMKTSYFLCDTMTSSSEMLMFTFFLAIKESYKS